MTNLRLPTFVLILAACFAATVFGQQTDTPAPPKGTDAKRIQEPSNTDRPVLEFFAAKLSLCQNGQVEFCKWAAQKATNPEVKEFAETLAKDHAKANELLIPFMPSYADAPITASKPANVSAADAKPADPKAVAPDARAENKPAKDPAAAKAVVETSLRVSDAAPLQRVYDFNRAAQTAHMAMCKEQLGKLSGAEFDRAFMAAQIGGHVMALAELKALESRTSGDVQAVVKQLQTSVTSHLQMAEKMAKDLGNVKESKSETK